MTDMKTVLLFLSYSMGPFLLYLFLNLFYFLVIIGVTVPVFFIGYTSGNYWLFGVYLVVVIVLSVLIRRLIFFKRRLGLNAYFFRFLDRLESSGDDPGKLKKAMEGKVGIPYNLKKILEQEKEDIQESGMKWVPGKLLLVFGAAHIGGYDFPEKIYDRGPLEDLKQQALRLAWLEAALFLFLLIPFVLISFLFTVGMESAVKDLIYTLGFFFAWFLHSSLVVPISSLILQKRMLEVV